MTRRFSHLLFSALSIFALLSVTKTNAQTGKLPPFRMMQAGGKIFKAEELPANKPVLLVYFSPDCDHCQKLMDSFFKQAAKFKKASIALVTFLPLAKLEEFEKARHLANYSNVYAGTEGSGFFVRNYYNIKEIPFVALYTKKGELVKSYERTVPLKELSAKLAALP